MTRRYQVAMALAIIAAALLLFTDWGAAILATEVGW